MRHRRTAFLLGAAILMFFVVAVSALEWPLSPAEPAAYFGTPDKGAPILGIALAAEHGIVRAAGAGELVFSRDSKDAHSVLPSTLGTFAVVEQEDGMTALYAHLAAGSVPATLRRVESQTLLAAVGETGFTAGSGLLFSLFDRKETRWVNPLLLLPPLEEKRAPLIRQAVLQGRDKSYVLGEQRTVPQGSYALSLDLSDPTGAAWSPGPSAPFYVRVLIDGSKIAELRYETAEAESGRLNFFPAEREGSSLRAGDGKTVLPARLFPRGKSLIEVFAKDYAGNERSASWSFSVE